MKVRLSSAASPIVSVSGSRYTAAGGSVSQRKIPPDCGWHPVQRNSMQQNFPLLLLLLLEKKTLSVAWLLESTTSSPRLHKHHPHFNIIYPLTAQRSLAAAGFLKISSIPWHYSPQVVRHNGAAVRQRSRATAQQQRTLSHMNYRRCLCPCWSSPSFLTVFLSPSLDLSAVSSLRFSCGTDRRIEPTAHGRSTHPVYSVLTGVTHRSHHVTQTKVEFSGRRGSD